MLKRHRDASGRFIVTAAHPALAGHFPGRPLVPGVVLLDHASRLILNCLPGRRLAGFAWVKFIRPVQPDEVVEVWWEKENEDTIAFALSVGGRHAAEGCAQVTAARS